MTVLRNGSAKLHVASVKSLQSVLLGQSRPPWRLLKPAVLNCLETVSIGVEGFFGLASAGGSHQPARPPALWCNGSTADSESACLGSNPSEATTPRSAIAREVGGERGIRPSLGRGVLAVEG